MFHEPPQQFLYSAYSVRTQHASPDGIVKGGTATAFVLDVATGVPWIVTNRHVVDLDYRQPKTKYKNFTLSEMHITGRRSDDSTYTLRLHPEAGIYFHADPENDVVMIQGRVWFDNPPNKFHWHFGLEHLATAEAFADSIRAFDLMCYAGFPDQHDKLSNRPIVRSGRIASDPKYSYSWDRSEHGMCVAYEGFSFPGASGSPIYAPPRGAYGVPDSRDGYLIGVNAGHVPSPHAGHSGISYFYKSIVLLDIIEQNNLKEA